MSTLNLFLLFLKIGTFGFGGGYAMLSFIQRELVDKRRVLTNEEFTQSLSLAQMSPGAIVVNTSASIGYRLKGTRGLLACTLGVLLPSFLIIVLLSGLYLRFSHLRWMEASLLGIASGVIALLVVVIIDLSKTSLRGGKELLIALFAFFSIYFFHLDPILIIALGGATGLLFFKGHS